MKYIKLFEQWLADLSQPFSLKENLLLEGGAYGHLSHPFEDLDLTMGDLKEMIDATVQGAFGPENFVQEKCIDGDTIITLKKLGDRKISDVVDNKLDDDILSMNELGEIVWVPIIDWTNNGHSNDWIVIEMEDGRKITVTPNHRMFRDNFDIRADQLNEGDYLTLLDV